MVREPVRVAWFINQAVTTLYGECNKPGLRIAGVEFKIQAAESFTVRNEVEVTDELRGLRFPEFAIFGFLDVAMVSGIVGSGKLQLTVTKAVVHPVDTSAMAFRAAGNDAGQKLLAILKQPSSTPPRSHN